MSLFHRLLHLLRISVDNEARSFRNTQDLPSFLKDMGEGQEIEHTIVFAYWHTLVVGLHGCLILATGKNHTLGVARSA